MHSFCRHWLHSDTDKTRCVPSTLVKLRTVTGELAPMLGRGVVAIQVGAADTVKRERPRRKSSVWRRSKITCIMETGPSAERHRSLTHQNGEHGRNRMLTYKQCCSRWSQDRSHWGTR